MGDRELAASIIEIFIQNTANLIESMLAEIDANNLDQVSKLAHSLKGSAASISAKLLSSMAYELEKSASKTAPENIREQIAKLKAEFKELKSNELKGGLACLSNKLDTKLG